MGLPVMHMWLAAALGASLCSAAPVSDSFVVSVQSPITVHRSHKTTLPCWLNPPQNAEGLEVRWYRYDNFDSPVLHYRGKKFEDTLYKGRVSFGLKDAASGGLTAGDVSLELANVTLEDAGDYTCYVSSDQGYDSDRVSLTVTETGTPLLLSAVWKEDNVVNMSCESGGWYPEPTLHWSDQKQVLTPKSLKYRKDSSGLLSVHSWLLLPSKSEVSCSVGLSGEEAKKARVHLENPPQPESGSSESGSSESGSSVSGSSVSGSSVAGWVLFTLAMLVLAGVGALYYFEKRGKKDTSVNERGDVEENQKLLPKGVIQPTDLSTFKKYFVNVTPDSSDSPYLTIKGCKFRDALGVHFPDGEKVTCLTAIKGKPGFSSGQHYWEVSMGKNNPNLPIKQSWWVGVTGATVLPQDLDSPTTSDGFWFLSSSPDRAEIFQFSTEPKVFLPVSSRPQTVGVYLDYDKGELSFYNVEREHLIGSFTATFTGEVFPFFNPGKGETAVMEILHRTEQGQAGHTGNSVDSSPQETDT